MARSRHPLRTVSRMGPPDSKTPNNRGKRVSMTITSSGADYDICGRASQTYFYAECGGCGAEVKIYRWSFYGHGFKICPECHGIMSRTQ